MFCGGERGRAINNRLCAVTALILKYIQRLLAFCLTWPSSRATDFEYGFEFMLNSGLRTFTIDLIEVW